jgi:hypothetical protein
VLFEVHSLIATVRGAHIVAFRSGRCDVTNELSCSGGKLLENTGQIDAPLVVSIGTGIPLLSAAEIPAGPWRGTARVSSAGQPPA